MFLSETLSASFLISSTYLPRTSPPATSTLTLAQRLATAAFSSAVKCTMLSWSFLLITDEPEASLYCCFSVWPFIPHLWPPAPWFFQWNETIGQGCIVTSRGGDKGRWTSVSLIVLGGSIRGILLFFPLLLLSNSYLKLPTTTIPGDHYADHEAWLKLGRVRIRNLLDIVSDVCKTSLCCPPRVWNKPKFN